LSSHIVRSKTARRLHRALPVHARRDDDRAIGVADRLDRSFECREAPPTNRERCRIGEGRRGEQGGDEQEKTHALGLRSASSVAKPQRRLTCGGDCLGR
jgi:hypothetical protein